MKYQVYPRNLELSAIEQVLVNRGLAREDIPQFLSPTVECLYSADQLDNIREAAKMLCKNLVHQNDIFIQVDSDCDGYTSAAVLINYLHRLFPTLVETKIHYHLHDNKHHGISIDNIPEGVKLVIAPDSSSNEDLLHQDLGEMGVDVIVLDHHHAVTNCEDPAIIVNNQMCDYPNKQLSGVGIVYKFCQILDEIFHVSYADDYLDLVALGMTADMMDLREPETHYYIMAGFNNIKNIFFSQLINKQEYSMQGKVTPFTTSWYIAPYINAMTRSGTDEEKLTLFNALLDFKAVAMVPSTKRGEKGREEMLVTQAIRVCTNVKSRQEDNKKLILNKILPTIQEDSLSPIIVVKFNEPIDANLNGLIANQIMGQFNKTCLVLNRIEKQVMNREKEIITIVTWEGSARGCPTFKIQDWRQFIADSGLALYAEGHPSAFGVGFNDTNVEAFIEYVSSLLQSEEDRAPSTYVDFEFNINDNFDNVILDIAQWDDMWGQHVERPVVALKSVPLSKDDVLLMGKGTLKIILKGHQTSCIKFNSESLYNKLIDTFPNDEAKIYVTIIGSCAINDFRGNISPQIKLIDCSIDHVTEWYF